jgi:hypothetical protein
MDCRGSQRLILLWANHNYNNARSYWRIASSGILRRGALVKIGDSEELSASFIRVTRIGGLGITLAVTSNRRTVGIVRLRTKVHGACSVSEHLSEAFLCGLWTNTEGSSQGIRCRWIVDKHGGQ